MSEIEKNENVENTTGVNSSEVNEIQNDGAGAQTGAGTADVEQNNALQMDASPDKQAVTESTDMVKAQGTEPVNTSESSVEKIEEEAGLVNTAPNASVGFFAKLKSFYTSEATKTKAFIITGCIAAAIILAVVLIIVLGGKKDEKIVMNDSGITPAVSATPTPTPVAVATATPSPTVAPTPTEYIEPSPTPTPLPDFVKYHEELGEMQSYINGNWVPKEVGNLRPYTMMLNNIAIANPQSGTACADILYEILVEGNITRLMGVFENLTDESSCKDRMGSVRSARHYYASIASEYDSIFIHFGETTYATKKIKALGLDHLEGLYAEGSTVFYRDKNIKSPHNAFASLAGIHKAIENKKFRTEYKEDFVPQHFRFAYPEGGQNSIERTENPNGVIEYNDLSSGSESGESISGENTGDALINENNTAGNGTDNSVDTSGNEQSASGSSIDDLVENLYDINGEVTSANVVKIPFSSYAQPYLTYDEETKLYTRYQFGGEHIDYNTKETLKFNNIIIQIVQESNRDKNGYQDIEGYSDKKGHHNKVTGKGYYICEGKCIEIKWEKDEAKFECNYFTLDGEILVMRPGKTFIAVYPNFREDKLDIQ